MNNKTSEYLESLPDEEKLKMIAQAIEEKQDYRVKYLKEKQRIGERKMQQMQERKEKKKRAKFLKQKKKEELDLQLTHFGGLWKTGLK